MKNRMNYRIKETHQICNEFFHIEKVILDHDKFEGGEHQDICRYIALRPDAVAVILENRQNDSIILVRQFRLPPIYHKHSGWQLEIIAGLVDPGETLEECVKREILEETGYEADSIEQITSFMPSIGVSGEVIHLFHAQTTSKAPIEEGGGLDHEHEDIEVVEKTLPEILQEITAQKIIDGKTIVAAQWLMLKKQGII